MHKWRTTFALLGMAVSTVTLAQEAPRNCLQLETKKQLEIRSIDAQGRPRARVSDVERFTAGQTLLVTIKARNVCEQPLDPAVVEFSIPDRTTYVLGSASGRDTDITFTLNGKIYGKFEALAIHDAGNPRAARPEDIKGIRWIYRKPLAPQASRSVVFRATAQ